MMIKYSVQVRYRVAEVIFICCMIFSHTNSNAKKAEQHTQLSNGGCSEFDEWQTNHSNDKKKEQMNGHKHNKSSPNHIQHKVKKTLENNVFLPTFFI